MELLVQPLVIPEGANIIFGQSHFIKTVEDLYEILIGSVPGIKFGLAFSEASVEVILAQSEQGRGVLGVIDGFSPKGVEEEKDRVWRKDLLRKFGYKL
jgi:adenosine/AMP kinase